MGGGSWRAAACPDRAGSKMVSTGTCIGPIVSGVQAVGTQSVLPHRREIRHEQDKLLFQYQPSDQGLGYLDLRYAFPFLETTFEEGEDLFER